MVTLCLFSVNAVGENCITIGIIGEFSKPTPGFIRFFGSEMANSADLAVEQINSSNPDICIKLQHFDTLGLLPNISPLLEQASHQGVKLFIGLGLSEQAIISSKTLDLNKLLLFSPTASDDALKSSGRIFTFFSFDANTVDKIVTRLSELKAKKVAVIYVGNNRHNVKVKNVFKQQFIQAGGEITDDLPVISGKINLAPYVELLKEKKPDYICISAYVLDANKIILELKKYNIDIPTIQEETWSSYSINIANSVNKYLKGRKTSTIIPVMYDVNAKNSRNIEFLKLFTQRYNKNPTDTQAFAYDAIFLIHKMLKNCSLDTLLQYPDDCLHKALPFDSVTGLIAKAQELNISRGVTLKTINMGS